MVRHPLTIRKLYHPSLQEWDDQGRATAAVVTGGGMKVVAASLYGFPRGHPRKHCNEVFLSQLFSWASELTMPLLLGGDLNENPHECSALTLVDMWKLHRISDESSTTRSRSGGLSGNALDHIIVNEQMLDLQAHAQVSHEEAISDHFPILGAFSGAHPRFLVAHWPRPPALPSVPVRSAPWVFGGTTFVEWSSCAEKWISDTFGVHVQPKTSYHPFPLCSLL